MDSKEKKETIWAEWRRRPFSFVSPEIAMLKHPLVLRYSCRKCQEIFVVCTDTAIYDANIKCHWTQCAVVYLWRHCNKVNLLNIYVMHSNGYFACIYCTLYTLNANGSKLIKVCIHNNVNIHIIEHEQTDTIATHTHKHIQLDCVIIYWCSSSIVIGMSSNVFHWSSRSRGSAGNSIIITYSYRHIWLAGRVHGLPFYKIDRHPLMFIQYTYLSIYINLCIYIQGVQLPI